MNQPELRAASDGVVILGEGQTDVILKGVIMPMALGLLMVIEYSPDGVHFDHWFSKGAFYFVDFTLTDANG